MNEKPTDARDTVIGYASQPLDERPTNVRHMVVGVMTASAFLMYLDRICMAQIVNSESFRLEFGFERRRPGMCLARSSWLTPRGSCRPGGWLTASVPGR